ncbi:MAG: Ig-like domain-containing protein, partial [Candidatus Kapabacteria bacterium]|nr:Ig-like domain-containing protein [Candidatus Kapabacteria bacterium]
RLFRYPRSMLPGSKFCCLWGIFLCGCANPLPPPGGPPDREAPRVVATEPVSGTINFRGRSVTLRFSEFVDKASVLGALRLQPPKPWEASWDWWGTTLHVRFVEPLDSNTTYVLTLGSEYRDMAGNTAETSTSVVFATGSHIDRGRIEGRLVDAQPVGVFVLAYPLMKINPDTLNPAHTRARYWTQIGTAGTFQLQGLPEGEYRLFALRDADRDGLYSVGRDAIGTTVIPVVVREDSPATVSLRLNLPVDTVAPVVVYVRSVSRQRLHVLFSEPVDTSSVTAAAFFAEDSAAAVQLPIVAAYLLPGNPKVVEVLFAGPAVDTAATCFLELVPGGIRDTAGNMVSGERRWRFRFRGNPDTATVRWVLLLRDSTRSILPWQPIELVAESPLDSSTATVTVADEHGRMAPILWEVRAPHHWRVLPMERWEAARWYHLRVQFRTNRLPGGRLLADTFVIRRFQVVDTRHYADIAGEVQDSGPCSGPYVVLLRAVRGGSGTWKLNILRPGPWRFREVPPGFYEVEVFCDADGNGRYTAGVPFPYRFAERYALLGPLELKPRWSVEGVVVRLP